MFDRILNIIQVVTSATLVVMICIDIWGRKNVK